MCREFHSWYGTTTRAPEFRDDLRFPLVKFGRTAFEWAMRGDFRTVPHCAPHPVLLMIRACNFHIFQTSGKRHLVLPACVPPSNGSWDSEGSDSEERDLKIRELH